ncbi:group III truncated hemoglobin [Olleya sp. YS]|uniref:group III truncated hemoglobin n=1 Tax=Olleya sp. YS TaxID=3028318 RepID=UPI00243427E8|nr:group III truncated hemoglobin [Olleya sp. YS]WGD34918.1 group III truncated hemoglobin [Olleya sp. YS]
MNRKTISTRDDVTLLVHEFYKKVRIDALLGPIFNDAITDWETHLDHLVTFWETSLFIGRKLEHKYTGNPLEAHVKIDTRYNQTITELHFGVWLNLWYATIDQYFEGDVADNAKRRARKMGTFMYLKIFEARHNKKL